MVSTSETYEEASHQRVVEPTRDVRFAESLAVQVGSMAEFEEWREDTDCEVTLVGAENVDNVVWHAGLSRAAVAATFRIERRGC